MAFARVVKLHHKFMLASYMKIADRGLLRDCITSIFAKVRLQLYWPQSGVMGLVPGESVASVIISHGGG